MKFLPDSTEVNGDLGESFHGVYRQTGFTSRGNTVGTRLGVIKRCIRGRVLHYWSHIAAPLWSSWWQRASSSADKAFLACGLSAVSWQAIQDRNVAKEAKLTSSASTETALFGCWCFSLQSYRCTCMCVCLCACVHMHTYVYMQTHVYMFQPHLPMENWTEPELEFLPLSMIEGKVDKVVEYDCNKRTELNRVKNEVVLGRVKWMQKSTHCCPWWSQM